MPPAHSAITAPGLAARPATPPGTSTGTPVEVIVPVYGNHADANALLASLAAARTLRAFVVTVVDDASPDPLPLVLPAPTPWLREAGRLANETNIGFAASVNRAIDAGHGDVVLLNSDTLVFDGWLDRLCAAAARDPSTATVTPLSNAATILSYPMLHGTGCAPIETDWATLDRLCAALGAPPVDVPTGVGFCMWISRACLAAIGPLDATVFAAGYGEENDFCRRAAAAGWRNVAAPDTFVWHRGEGSFGARGRALRSDAHRRLLARHPDYDRLVATHIRADPLLGVRRQLDSLRLARDPRPTCLDLAGDTVTQGKARKMLRLHPAGGRLARVWRPAVEGFGPLPNLTPLTRFASRTTIESLFAEAGVSEVLLPVRTALPATLVRRLLAVARERGLPIHEAVTTAAMTQRLATHALLSKAINDK